MKEFLNKHFGAMLIALAIAFVGYAGMEIAQEIGWLRRTLKCFENYSGTIFGC